MRHCAPSRPCSFASRKEEVGWGVTCSLSRSVCVCVCVCVHVCVDSLSPQLARTLIEFESLWFQAWERSTDTAKKGLRAKLIVQDQPTSGGSGGAGKLHVNFDQGVLQLMREAKHLSLMGFDIPNSARVVLLLEDKLKSYVSHRQTDRYARTRTRAAAVWSHSKHFAHPAFVFSSLVHCFVFFILSTTTSATRSTATTRSPRQCRPCAVRCCGRTCWTWSARSPPRVAS